MILVWIILTITLLSSTFYAGFRFHGWWQWRGWRARNNKWLKTIKRDGKRIAKWKKMGLITPRTEKNIKVKTNTGFGLEFLEWKIGMPWSLEVNREWDIKRSQWSEKWFHEMCELAVKEYQKPWIQVIKEWKEKNIEELKGLINKLDFKNE